MKRLAIVVAVLCLVLPVEAKPKAEIKSQWRGAKVAYLGDSITDKRQVERGQNDTYWVYLESLLGITPYVYGISGNQWSHIPKQTDKLIAERGEDIDAIMIFVGTNDYNANVPLGEWYSEESVDVVAPPSSRVKNTVTTHRQKRTLLMDGSTERGRINIAMAKLKEAYPTKQIILLTPIHRGTYISEGSYQPTELYSNSIGEYIDAYVEVVKEAGNVWAVPVIDLNSICGLYPLEAKNGIYWRRPMPVKSAKSGRNLEDRLHPNSAGHKRMALALAYQLLGYPAKVD